MNPDNDNEEIDQPQANAEQVSHDNDTDIESVTRARLQSFLKSEFPTDDAEGTEATEDDSNQVEDQTGESEYEDDAETTQNEDGNEVLSQSDEEDEDDSGNLPRGVKKRIDKLTAKRREAEAEVERLKQELEAAKINPQVEEIKVNHSNVPFSNLNTTAEIEAEIAQARSVKRWCEEHADGYTVENEDGTERHYSREEIVQIKLNAIDALEEHLPKRAAYIQTKEKIEPLAKQVYGNIWGKMDTRERKIADAFIKAFPEITKFPDYKLLVGDLVSGMKSREQRTKQGQVVKKAPSVPRPSSAAPKANTVDRVNAAERRFSRTGDKSDLKDIILNKFL